MSGIRGVAVAAVATSRELNAQPPWAPVSLTSTSHSASSSGSVNLHSTDTIYL